jgi:hypothetical protein
VTVEWRDGEPAGAQIKNLGPPATVDVTRSTNSTRLTLDSRETQSLDAALKTVR